MQASTEYLLLDNWITKYKYLQNTYYRVSRLLNPNTWTILQKLVGYKKILKWISELLNPSNVKKENTKKYYYWFSKLLNPITEYLIV